MQRTVIRQPSAAEGTHIKHRHAGQIRLYRGETSRHQGCIFDPDLLYERFPNELIPYDYDEYFRNCHRGYKFEMVATNCLTGRAEYLSESDGDRHRLLAIARASSSLPYVSKIVQVDGKPMLDGGIIDSIPVVHAIATGHERNVIVTTHSKGWRDNGRDRRQPAFIYRRYPRLRVLLSHRLEVYNRQMDYVDELEAAGKALVIRPEAAGTGEKDREGHHKTRSPLRAGLPPW